MVVEGKNWWESAENWTVVLGGLFEFLNWEFGWEIPAGAAAGVAAVVMVILRNFRTSEPIKQFNRQLRKELKNQ